MSAGRKTTATAHAPANARHRRARGVARFKRALRMLSLVAPLRLRLRSRSAHDGWAVRTGLYAARRGLCAAYMVEYRAPDCAELRDARAG